MQKRIEYVPWRGSYWPDADGSMSFGMSFDMDDDDDDDDAVDTIISGGRSPKDGSQLTAHTNWRVSRADVGIIEAVDGVEAVRAVSPYRLDLGIAPFFSTADVQAEIRLRLCGPPPVRPGERLGVALRRVASHWAIAGKGPRHAFVGADRLSVEEAVKKAGLEKAIRDSSWND